MLNGSNYDQLLFQYLACLSTSSSNDKLSFDVGLQEHSHGKFLVVRSYIFMFIVSGRFARLLRRWRISGNAFPRPVLSNTANVYKTKTSAHDGQNEEVTKGIFYFKMHF